MMRKRGKICKRVQLGLDHRGCCDAKRIRLALGGGDYDDVVAWALAVAAGNTDSLRRVKSREARRVEVAAMIAADGTGEAFPNGLLGCD